MPPCNIIFTPPAMKVFYVLSNLFAFFSTSDAKHIKTSLSKERCTVQR